MTVGSLFSGIGGFDLAATRCGMDVRWQVEKDEWCRRVLAKHWPEVPKYGDIRELTGDELEPVDLVCGGFPCQPFSQAGKQLGEADTRHLWPEMRRLVERLRPRWVVGENVPPLVRLGLDAVWADLEALGYSVRPLCIPACAIGAPHVRERLWILAHANHERRQEQHPSRVACDAGHLAGVFAAPVMADAYGGYGQRRRGSAQVGRFRGAETTAADGHATGTEWRTEPGVGRVAHGIPHRVDRLRGLGNAIVPQVAERLFGWILEAEGGVSHA